MSKASALQKQAAEDAADAAQAAPAQGGPPTRGDIQNDTNRRIVETISAIAGLDGQDIERVVIRDIKPARAFPQHTVMAVVGIGIECDVADQAELVGQHRLLAVLAGGETVPERVDEVLELVEEGGLRELHGLGDLGAVHAFADLEGDDELLARGARARGGQGRVPAGSDGHGSRGRGRGPAGYLSLWGGSRASFI